MSNSLSFLWHILVELCKISSKKFKKVCIVNVNKPYVRMVEKFKENKIDYSNYYFVDCISASFMNELPKTRSTYVSSPSALTELAIALNNIPSDIQFVVLDSFSGLAFYNGYPMALRFLNSITGRFREKGLKAVYLVVGETKKEILADLSLFADEILEL